VIMRAGDPLSFVEVRLSLLSPAEGGRTSPVTSGYMPNWWLPGSPTPTLASALLELADTDHLRPGATGTARVVPFSPTLWEGVAVGTELVMTEGPDRRVGTAVVTRVATAAVSAA